jgi:tripartite-type tricarboxylate transporter receptor subunit TctC
MHRLKSPYALIGRVTAAAVMAAAFTGAAWPQAFPARNVTLVVPFPPGGGTDLFARAIGQELAAKFGRPVVIENRGGASGNIGAEMVVRSAPDGHTLLYTAAPIALSQAVYKKLAFDAQRDLSPITMTVSIPQVLVVHPALPAKSTKELVALARSKPGMLTYSSGGAGSAGHFASELFKLRTEADMRHVPYRGAAPALTALISGETQVAFLVPPVVMPQLQAGKLRALAVSFRKRSTVLPKVPTLHELGYATFEALQWHGMFAPANTPGSTVELLSESVKGALAAPAVQSRLSAEGAEVVGSSPAEFAAFFKAELAKWLDVAKRAGMKLD